MPSSTALLCLDMYGFVAMLLKYNFNKSGFRVLENRTPYDILKRLSLRSPTFVCDLMGSGIRAITSSNTSHNTRLGQAAQKGYACEANAAINKPGCWDLALDAKLQSS